MIVLEDVEHIALLHLLYIHDTAMSSKWSWTSRPDSLERSRPLLSLAFMTTTTFHLC